MLTVCKSLYSMPAGDGGNRWIRGLLFICSHYGKTFPPGSLFLQGQGMNSEPWTCEASPLSLSYIPSLSLRQVIWDFFRSVWYCATLHPGVTDGTYYGMCSCREQKIGQSDGASSLVKVWLWLERNLWPGGRLGVFSAMLRWSLEQVWAGRQIS